MSNRTISRNKIISSHAEMIISYIINTANINVRERIALDNLKYTRTIVSDTDAELRFHLTQMVRARARRYSDKGIFTRFIGKNGAYFMYPSWQIYPSKRRWTPNEHLEEH